MGACLLWLFTRVGVLAAIIFFVVVRSIGVFGLAFDAWSTPYLVSWLAVLLIVATYGFWMSLAGRPILKGLIPEPETATA